MDPITFGKAKQTINKIKQVNDQILAPLVEGRFITLQERLDWIEAQANAGKLTRDVQIDLSQGTHTNTEVINGKIQLKQLEYSSSSRENAIPAMTSPTQPSGKASASSEYSTGTAAYLAFDRIQGSSTFTNGWQTALNVTSAWLEYEFPSSICINAYTITPYNHATEGPLRSPKSWTFEGSNDNGITWVILDTQDNVTDWVAAVKKTFSFNNQNEFTKYRINISSNNGSTYISIGEMEMLEAVSIHASSGVWESPIIDLSQGWIKTNLMSLSKQIQSGLTDCAIEIAYSTDGQSFSAYAPIDTANPPQARYIKLKATLTAIAQPQTPEVVEYDQADPRTEVTLNEYVVANGDLKLQTEYQYPMIKDTAYTETGALFRKALDKNSFKSIEKIEVR